MYFAFGWPKFFSTGTSGTIVDIKYNSDCSLIACLTYNSIILWSGDQHRIRLGHCTRKEESVAATGGNISLCWAPDSSLLAVITAGGHIYLYVIRKEWQDPLEFTYVQPQHIPSSLSTPTTKLLRVSQASSFLVSPGGAACICGDGDLLYIVTKNNYVVVMLWTGDIVEQFSISDISFLLDSSTSLSAALQDMSPLPHPPQMNGDTPKANQTSTPTGTTPTTKLPQLPPNSITQFTYAPSIHTFCMVLSNGAVVVMQSKPTTAASTTTSLASRLKAYFLSFPSSTSGSGGSGSGVSGSSGGSNGSSSVGSGGGGCGKAVCVALNACHRLAAVGCEGGEVRLYKIPQLFLHSSLSSSSLLSSSNLKQPTSVELLTRSLTASQLQQTEIETETETETEAALPQQKQPPSQPPDAQEPPPQHSPHRIGLQHPPKIGSARVFTLIHWGIKGDDTGPVSIVAWTRDERALAVGWAKRGFSLWSIHGCRLVCTIPQLEGFGPKSSTAHDVTATPPPSPRSAPPPYFSSELARDGVVTLAWGPNSYHLLVATHNESAFLQLSLVKSCLACNPTFCYSERILLQADDRLLFMCYKGSVPGEVEWKHLHIPHTYLVDNWPMKFAAMSRDGTQIAVTGRRGLILYSNITGRWKMFGDRNQEQEIICSALCWYKHIVVLASLNETIGKYELLLFPRQHLSYSSMSGRQEMPRRRVPHLMDCNDSYLVLFTKDSCLYLYNAVESGPSEKISVYLQLVHQVSLASVAVPLTITLLPESVQPTPSSSPSSPVHTPIPPASPIAVAPTFAPSSANNQFPTPPQCLIHYTSGKLVLLHLAENREDELAADVEQPWLGRALTDFSSSPSSSEESHIDANGNPSSSNSNSNGSNSPRKANLVSESAGRTLWAYGEQGLTVWVPFPGPHKQLMSRDRSLDFDNEVYPVGFVSDLGIVVGLTQGVSFGLGTPLPFFEIHTKTHPFLHSILRNKIESFDDAQALSIARKFEHVPHFAHSLELLLHEVLESECENHHLSSTPTKSLNNSDPLSYSTLLSRVANFMRNFPQFPDIVVQCARKTDAAFWQFLFEGVGDPRVLFEDCVTAGKFSTAASYLKILQNICYEGHIVSRRAALRLLEKVLDIDDVELAGELTRFLGPVPIPKSVSPSPSSSISSVSSVQHGDDSSNLHSHYNIETPLVDIGITPDDEEYYMQELLLGRYARKLLSRKQLRHLLLFAWRVGHSIRPWLVRERTRSATLDSLEEWKSALTALHLQFYIPKPERMPPIPTAYSLPSTPNSTPPPSPRGGPHPSPLPSPMIQVNSFPPTSPLAMAASTPFARKIPIPPSLTLSTSSLIPDIPNLTTSVPLPPPPPSPSSTPHSSSSLSLPSMRDPLFLQDSIEYASADLTYLQEEMLAAKCNEWGLIIATVLLNITVIISILRSNGQLWKQYRQLLVSQEGSSQGYSELRAFLDEIFIHKTKLFVVQESSFVDDPT